MRRVVASILTGVMAFCSSTALAQLSYDESTDGDLSGAFATPDQLTFGLGVNTITGNVGSDSSTGATNGTDADYFWFSLGAGQTIDSIFTRRSGPGGRSFVGYRAGTAFAGQDVSDIDANALFEDESDITSFAGALEEGNHVFWIQEIGGAADYSISFNVVPEPSAAVLLVGISLFAGLGRRRRS